MRTLPSERGQAIVLIVIAIVGLFGFAALAIDLGQVYAARRSAQNAADAAALAAAYEFSAGSQDADAAVQKGKDIALANGYDNNETNNWVRVENGPISGPYCRNCPDIQFEDAYDYYQVLITVRLQPIFAQMIFKGIEEVQVEAIAHATTAEAVSAGNALFSLSREADSMDLKGNVKVNINGGSIRSNGGMDKSGNSGDVYVDPKTGGVWFATGAGPKKTGPFTGAKPLQQDAVRMGSIKPPACPKAADTASWASGGDYKYKEDPTYGTTTYYWPSGLSNKGKSVLNLPAGIHCIDGGIGKGDYSGTGILIVLLSGGIQQTGGDSFDWRAATDMKDANGNQWGGMVFYAPASNKEVLKFGGNSGGYFQGVVYAPGATCDFGGNPDDSAVHTAMICNRVFDHGDGTLTIQYVPEELFHFPPLVELVQ